ncbi:LOW QUALITY PROTEIN: heavy metal translocating P-type ATPase, partial [Brucella abortus bv. 6 str. 870]
KIQRLVRPALYDRRSCRGRSGFRFFLLAWLACARCVLSGCDLAGCCKPMCHCHLGALRHSVGTCGLRARRRSVQGRQGAGNARGDRYFCIRQDGNANDRQGGSHRLETLIPESEFLSLLAGLEAHSEHPIAEAIRNYATLHDIQCADVGRVTAIPSEGVVGHTSTGAEVWAGNSRMVSRKKANVDIAALEALGRHAETVIYLGRGHEILGAVTVADQPRISSVAGLDALRRDGLKKLVMLTGDRRAVALRIGAKLGFSPEDIHADLLPEDKVRLVGALAEGGRVAFVGDGVNDAAAFARSDVGIAMGVAGSEVALQAADVALLSDNMERLAAARRVARRTRRIIRQNLAFAIGAMVLLAFSSLFLSLPMPLAVLGHEGGTVLVVLNGLRLLADPIRGNREK